MAEGNVSRQRSTYCPLHLGWIHSHPTAAAEGNVSRQHSTHTVHSISVGFTYKLQQRRRRMLADSSAHILSTPSRLDSLTSYSSDGGECSPTAQHTYCPLHLGWIHLHATAAAEGNVSRQLSPHTVHSTLVGFTYKLQQRRRVMLADSSAHILSTPLRLDSLTRYSCGRGEF